MARAAETYRGARRNNARARAGRHWPRFWRQEMDREYHTPVNLALWRRWQAALKKIRSKPS